MNILLHFVLNQTCLDFGAAFGGILQCCDSVAANYHTPLWRYSFLRETTKARDYRGTREFDILEDLIDDEYWIIK